VVRHGRSGFEVSLHSVRLHHKHFTPLSWIGPKKNCKFASELRVDVLDIFYKSVPDFQHLSIYGTPYASEHSYVVKMLHRVPKSTALYNAKASKLNIVCSQLLKIISVATKEHRHYYYSYN
jgi:hypothetical protein